MLPKLAIFFFTLLILAVQLYAVPLELYQRNIPVEVRYEDDVVRVVPREVQARRNLDAKVQLNVEELREAFRHLPMQAEPQVVQQGEELKVIEEVPLEKAQVVIVEGQVADQPQVELIEEPQIIVQQPVEIPKVEEVPAVKSLISEEEVKAADEAVKVKSVSSAQVPSTINKILQESHDIIKSGLKNLKDSFKPGKDEFSPSSEQWETLEKAVDNYFEEEKQKLLIRQNQGSTDPAAAPTPPAQEQNNWIQNIVNGFNGIAANFVQSIQNIGAPTGGNPPPQGQGDEGAQQPPASQGFQGFIQFFNNGISNIVSTITGSTNNGPTTSNTNLSDQGASSQQQGPIGFFGAIVTNVQNALGIPQQGQAPSGAQGDQPANQQQNGPVQVIQSVGNAISNFFTGATQNRPDAPGDEGASSSQPSNANVIQNIQNAIQNSPFNPFRPQGGSNAQNPIQNAIQSVGTQVQQLAPSSGQPQVPQPDGAKKPATATEEKPIKDNEISDKDTKKPTAA